MYYVEILDSKITGKAFINKQIKLDVHQKEISKEMYTLLESLPANFTQNNSGEIIEVMPIVKPLIIQPKTELEQLREDLKTTQDAVDFILLNY